MKPKFVSPSRIARFYYHECERYLRYTSTPREDRAAEGIPSRDHDTSPVTAAILEGGYVWEEDVVDRLGSRVAIAAADPAKGAVPVRDRVLSADDARSRITNVRAGEYVYQPTLVPPVGFYERYGLDPEVVAFTETRPDLIEAFEDEEGLLRLRVIDVKASATLKLSHRIQAALYTLILRDLLLDWGVTDLTPADDAGVWLVNADKPETFDLRSILPPLETFLEHELQPLMARPAADARWHVWFRCEWCPYFDHCRDAARATDDVSLFPYLSVHAKRYLTELDPPVRTIAEFGALLDDPRRVAVLDDAASLRNRPERLRAQTTAMTTGSVELLGGASLAMPKAEHIRVILALQTEPVSGQVYTWGLYAHGLIEVIGERSMTIARVAPTHDLEARDALERDLIVELHGLLSKVDTFDRARPDDWKAQKTLQVYVFDSYERAILTDLLVRRLADPVVAERALQLFFHFQRPELLGADEHPASEVFFPVVVLASVVRDLTALPAETTYRFPDIVRLFAPASGGFAYRENDFFGFELSSQLKSDAIFHAWHRGRSDLLTRIEQEVKARLWATNSVVYGLRERLEPTGALFAWPPKFFLPDADPYAHTVLSRLAFIARYESVVGYLALRGERMAPIHERIRDQVTVPVSVSDDDRFLLDPEVTDLDIEAEDFANWILSEDSEAGARAMLAYDDFRYRAKMWIPSALPIALAGITEVQRSPDGRPVALRLRLRPSTAFPKPTPGRRYHLDARYSDFLSGRTVEELREVDAEADPPFVRLITDTVGFAGLLPLPNGVRARALELAHRHGMTASQLVALEGMLDRRLQVVWGPPGTGKTHFLALAILCLAEAHRADGRSFRVLVTAFTHAAIDNCLRKIVDLDAGGQIVRGGLPVGKIGRRSLEGMDEVVGLYDRGEGWPLDGDVGVVGGTVWGLRKRFTEPGFADLVVVDEGSQLEVPESSIAVRRLASDGRLVVAGDDRQLPPIVQGVYPDPTDGEPLLHRSLFECLRAGGAPVATLLENWRSNRELCRYPAAQIYVPEYTSATPEIAARRITFGSGSVELPKGAVDLGITAALMDAVLDPEAPLVVGVLEGVRAAAENRVEAGLVAACALQMRARLLARDGRTYPAGHLGDRAFWTDGLFIVSPHHAQIHAIDRALRAGRAWEYPPFVDTVDKMQGQESDAVIVSYGVSDVEYAMGEKEFIYSLNRLNVSITRGRAKTIVFLPRPLIEPPIQAFEDDRIADGVAFMQGLVRWAEHDGEARRWDLAGGAALCLYVGRGDS